jgi:cell division protein FtsB
LEEELERQENQFLQDSLKLVNLDMHPEEIVKIAREKYFMKANDEDIFMLSDELEGDGNEAVE